MLPEGELGSAAGLYALASAKAADATTHESLQQKAIQLLRSAHAAGALPPSFPNGSEFAALRKRADFPSIVAEFEATTKEEMTAFISESNRHPTP